MGLSKIFSDFDQFDLLFKDFFVSDSIFGPISTGSIYHPIDIRESGGDLVIEIAVVGLKKEDVKINVEEGNLLRVVYNKPDDVEKNNDTYITKRIARKSFNFGWRVSSKFNLQEIEAKMENGLLTIIIKKAKGNEPKEITIK